MEDGPVPPQARRSDESTDALDERIASTPSLERPAAVVDHLTPGTSGDSLDWIAEVARRAERYGFSVAEVRSVSTDLAWLARLNGQRYPGRFEWDFARSLAGTEMHRRVLTYVNGQRLRFDFKFAQLYRHASDWLADFGDDALVLGLAAFGALGAREPNGLDLLNRALDAPEVETKSRHVCLAALGFADHVEGQAERILQLSDDMMASGERGGNVCFRRARAFRKLDRYDEALAEIDRAMDLLDAGQNLVHEQYVQERFAIIAAQDMHTRVDRLADDLGTRISARADERIEAASSALEERLTAASTALEERITHASDQLAQRVDSAQEMVSSGLLKMVEVLGVFVTLAGFLVGSGTVVIKAQTFNERAIAMGLVIVGSVVFFGLLRLITGTRRRKRAL